MTPEKVWATLEWYDHDIKKHGFGVQQFSDADYDHCCPIQPLPRRKVLSHCRWMIEQCLTVFRPEFEAAWGVVEFLAVPKLVGCTLTPEQLTQIVAAREPLEKAMRWLCYIQGACHAHGLYSCNDLRDHSRGDGVPVLRAMWDAGLKLKNDSGQTVSEYPCCEGARRVEAVPGDATTLLGGLCPNHGATRNVPRKPQPVLYTFAPGEPTDGDRRAE